jgi:DNA-binding GntR family transcriptional regulator
LVQDDLAAAFGVSRIPLREALRQLEGEGLVTISPNRGAIVRPLAPKDIVDLYDLRLALETLAVRRAAERFVDVRGSTARLAEEAQQAVEQRALTRLFHLDRDFHADIAAGSDNPHLIAALGSQWWKIMRVMHAYLKVGTYAPSVWQEHQLLAEVISYGDPDRAEAVLRSHLLTSRDKILTDLRENAAALR